MNDCNVVIDDKQQIIYEHLINKIIRLVGCAHQRGYPSLYLHASLSPSGVHWRYQVATPTMELFCGSITGGLPDFPWLSDWNAPVAVWLDDFIAYFQKSLIDARQANNEYVSWYQMVLEAVGTTGYFTLHSDYDCKPSAYKDGKQIPLPSCPSE